MLSITDFLRSAGSCSRSRCNAIHYDILGLSHISGMGSASVNMGRATRPMRGYLSDLEKKSFHPSNFFSCSSVRPRRSWVRWVSMQCVQNARDASRPALLLAGVRGSSSAASSLSLRLHRKSGRVCHTVVKESARPAVQQQSKEG